MLDKIILGAVRGVVREVIPSVAIAAENAVSTAHATPASVPIKTATAEPVDPAVIEARILSRLQERPEFQAVQSALAPIPWYKSPVIVGGIVSVVSPFVLPIAASYGLDQAEVNTYLAGTIAFIGGAIVLYGRIFKGTAQPVTLTARGAADGRYVTE